MVCLTLQLYCIYYFAYSLHSSMLEYFLIWVLQIFLISSLKIIHPSHKPIQKWKWFNHFYQFGRFVLVASICCFLYICWHFILFGPSFGDFLLGVVGVWKDWINDNEWCANAFWSLYSFTKSWIWEQTHWIVWWNRKHIGSKSIWEKCKVTVLQSMTSS